MFDFDYPFSLLTTHNVATSRLLPDFPWKGRSKEEEDSIKVLYISRLCVQDFVGFCHFFNFDVL